MNHSLILRILQEIVNHLLSNFVPARFLRKVLAMSPQDTLKKNKLRITNSRLEILQIFIDNAVALSQSDIESQIGENCDRATIYRTLGTFLEEGLIHKVLDSQSIIKYALCKDTCIEGNHRHEHVHFKCNDCGHTICLEGIKIQPIQLPKGYKATESNLLVVGVCVKCNKSLNSVSN